MASPAVRSPSPTDPLRPELRLRAEPEWANPVGLCRFAVVTTALTILLIQLGGMVTSTASGLAYYDWPMANGSWWPKEMKEWSAGLLEHGHRTYATLIGLLILLLAVWTIVVERRAWVRRLAIALLALVSLQGVIGGYGIKLGLPVWTSTLHGVLAQVLLCGLTVFAFATSRAWRTKVAAPAAAAHTARRLCALAVAATLVQLVLGAIVRHANLHGVLWLHVTVAVVVAFAILTAALYVSARLPQVQGVRGTARALLAVLSLQIVLGIATLVVRGGGKETASLDQLARALTITGHVVVGAVMFLLATLLCARVWRNLEPAA